LPDFTALSISLVERKHRGDICTLLSLASADWLTNYSCRRRLLFAHWRIDIN